MKKVSITRVKRLYLCCIQINVVDSHFGEHFLCVVIHTNDKHRLYVSRRCFCFIITEYSDLKTTLSIYEAKEKRYLDILEDIKDEQDAISVENELTSIQVEIAKIKTRMNNIENDVAYYFINLTVNEVRKYSDKPVVERTDTFGQRLKNTISKTWDSFLYFLENLLFIIIRVLPFLIVIGIIIFIIVKIIKFFCKRAEKRKKEKYQQRMQQAPPMMQGAPMPPNPQMIPPNVPP